MSLPFADRLRRHTGASLAGGAGFFLLAWGTILLTGDGSNVAAIWPPNALLLAIILQLHARQWPVYFLTAFAANFLAEYLVFGSIVAPLLYSVVNLAEVALAGWLLRRWEAHDSPLESVRSVIRFAVCASLAPALCAFVGAAAAWQLVGAPYWVSWRIWYFSSALGFLIFTPLFLGLLSGHLARWWKEMGRFRRIEAIAIFLLVGLFGLFTFLVPGYPMLFLMHAPVLFATFRLGRFGTKLALIITAVIGTASTMLSHGPIAAMIADRGEQALFLQFYLGVVLVSTLPIAAELHARRTMARRLAESEAGLRLLASESADALLRLDEAGCCVQSSGATRILLGIEGRALVGRPLASLVDPRDSGAVEQALAEALGLPGSVAYCEFRPRDRADDWLECTMRALVNGQGRAYGAIGAIRDITLRKEREVNLWLAASTDGLTGALNHAAFMAHLDRALAHLTSSHLALIMVDIDHFKQVNDLHGHPAGDRALIEVHDRIRALVRDHDVIGRLGGDEIAILLDGVAEELALSIAGALREAVGAHPVTMQDGEKLSVTVSCGVAQAHPGISREMLIRRADEALYRAKAEGRDRVAISSD